MLKGVSLLVVLLFVSISMPEVEAADGRNEHGKYYWSIGGSVANLQVAETSAQWSVRYSDDVVDQNEFWGEIRMDQQELTTQPYEYPSIPRDTVGYVRLFVQPELPQQPAGYSGGLRRWDMRLIFVVHAPDAHNLPYDLGGFTTRYLSPYTTDYQIRQINPSDGWEDELGGVNAAAVRERPLAEEWMEDVFGYAVGQTISHPEVDLALDMIRTWEESHDDRPSWNGGPYDNIGGRHNVFYTQDDDSYDGRYMVFWDKITLQIPDDEGIPQDGWLKVGIDGLTAGYDSHEVDYWDTSWTINIDVTDDLEDAPPSGGGGGGGGGWLIPMSSPEHPYGCAAESYEEKDNLTH